MKAEFLRKKYPIFVYNKYSFEILNNDLKMFFDFEIEPDINFRPEIIIENINKEKLNRMGEGVLDNLVFHLGLIEMLSYWKAICSPVIEIKAGALNNEQIKWWKDLIIKGMGQFFFENGINFKDKKFLKITADKNGKILPVFGKKLGNEILLPLGGGKDSIVSLEALKKKAKITAFGLNPALNFKKITETAGLQDHIFARRKIDGKLLELNREGFLNGHTPFSAYLAFLCLILAVIFDKKYIVLSNERSSNEGNVKYLGRDVNHQYSKSFDFEKRFRRYSKKYLVKDAEYFSFLRPLYEVQIAKIFSEYPQYFNIFLSCNEAFKTASGTQKPEQIWCGKCPKCLSVFVFLYPFVENDKLTGIFKKNLFEDKNLAPLMRQLTGQEKFKPFECVGTKKESLTAFYLSWKKAKIAGEMPFLLKYFEEKIMPKYPNLEKESGKIMNSWNKENNLTGFFERILKGIL